MIEVDDPERQREYCAHRQEKVPQGDGIGSARHPDDHAGVFRQRLKRGQGCEEAGGYWMRGGRAGRRYSLRTRFMASSNTRRTSRRCSRRYRT